MEIITRKRTVWLTFLDVLYKKKLPLQSIHAVSYTHLDNVGGRFSVLTPVGLLPIAIAGFDIEKLVAGAVAMEKA